MSRRPTEGPWSREIFLPPCTSTTCLAASPLRQGPGGAAACADAEPRHSVVVASGCTGEDPYAALAHSSRKNSSRTREVRSSRAPSQTSLDRATPTATRSSSATTTSGAARTLRERRGGGRGRGRGRVVPAQAPAQAPAQVSAHLGTDPLLGRVAAEAKTSGKTSRYNDYGTEERGERRTAQTRLRKGTLGPNSASARGPAG